jgi:hypothetical protein
MYDSKDEDARSSILSGEDRCTINTYNAVTTPVNKDAIVKMRNIFLENFINFSSDLNIIISYKPTITTQQIFFSFLIV